jgi:hypothetical protein
MLSFRSNVILFSSDYHHIKRQIESEMIQTGGVTSSKPFLDLSKPEHLLKLKDRLKKYCQKVVYLNSWINPFGGPSLTILMAQCRRTKE